jgi:hypothetical protein
MRPALILATLVVCISSAASQQIAIPDGVRAAANRITADQLSRDLNFLASDELQGRNTPSAGFDKAAEYIAARLRRAGLEPLGDDGTYFQRYVMRETHVDTSAAYVEIDGKRFPFGDGFVVRSFAGAVSGPRPVVYVGHGWMVPDRKIDPYAGLDLTGKIVVAHGPRATPRGVEIRQIGRINLGASGPIEEAARRGAAAVIYVPSSRSLETWKEMREQNTVVRELDPRVPSAYAAAPVTSVLLARDTVAALFEAEGAAAVNLIERGDRQEYAAPFQLGKQITLHVPSRSTTVHRPYNVVALLEGTDAALKEEYVTVEAHLDGSVEARTVDGDGIYNSADDNASGSAASLAIAEAMIAGPRPKRSVIFIWDSGEERGLWGTRHFVHSPPVSLERIAAHFNIDMIGANRAPGSADADETRVTGPDEVFVIGPRVLSGRAAGLLDAINRAYLNLRFNHEYDTAESEFFYPRTDAGPFLERGILTIGFTTGIHDRYHGPSDEARYLDPRKMEAIARTVLVSVWMFADAGERPAIDRPIPATVPRFGKPSN